MESSGERLKKIRLSKGIKLEDVHKKTKIHLNILQALEGDGMTDLNPIYLKGFLKLYCHFLGVDPKNYIPDYQEPKGIVSSTRLEEMAQEREAVVEQPKPITAKPANRPPEKPFHQPAATPVSTPPPLKLRSSEPRPNSLVPMISMVVLTGLLSYGLFNLGKVIFSKHGSSPGKIASSHKAMLPIEIKREELRQDKVQKARPTLPAVKSGPEQQPMAIPPSKETVSGIRLVIRAKENCWISLKMDGRVVFQRVLEKGRFGGWKAKDRIEMSLGNAGAVELEINGKLFTNLGRKGQARKNIVITREGLNIEG
jgi:transcriptional regulator with XRE-family HTH domain